MTSTATAFLDTLRTRHTARLPKDRVYERMMYAARNPPSRDTFAPLLEFLADEREDVGPDTRAPRDPQSYDGLGDLLAGMVWPDPAPLVPVARLLEGWNTVAVTTLLHTQIPDYPIFGPVEARGLRRLGYDVEYVDDPLQAETAYGAAIEAVKNLREQARWDQVPESHHFLTRIVQASLAELAHEEDPL